MWYNSTEELTLVLYADKSAAEVFQSNFGRSDSNSTYGRLQAWKAERCNPQLVKRVAVLRLKVRKFPTSVFSTCNISTKSTLLCLLFSLRQGFAVSIRNDRRNDK